LNDFLATYVYVFGVRFHLYTAVLLGFTLLVGWLLLGRVKPLGRLVGVAALGAFVVHLYEVFHASGEWLFTGTTGLSVLTINIPSVVLALLVLRRYAGVKPRLVSTFSALLGLGLAVLIMGYQGFYQTLNYDAVWAAGKIMASLMGLAVVHRD
jgi:hypothetical protein